MPDKDLIKGGVLYSLFANTKECYIELSWAEPKPGCKAISQHKTYGEADQAMLEWYQQNEKDYDVVRGGNSHE